MSQVEFGLNAEAQKFLSKSGKTLAEAVSTFTSDMNTLVNKTIEDTMINAKQYEAVRWAVTHFLFPVQPPCRRVCVCDADLPPMSRIEYDAYRVDLEELNLGPRDATTVPKLECAQKEFQAQRERYEKMRDALSVKLKLLEENKVRVSRVTANLIHTMKIPSVCVKANQISQ